MLTLRELHVTTEFRPEKFQDASPCGRYFEFRLLQIENCSSLQSFHFNITFFLLMLVLSTDILTNGLPSVFRVVQSELLRFRLMS